MDFEKIKSELIKVAPGSQTTLDLSLIDTTITTELSKYLKFKHPNILYLWGAKFLEINPDLISLSGEFEAAITDTYFRINIYVLRTDPLNYYVTIQPKMNWLNEVHTELKSFINNLPVSIDLDQTLFIFSSTELAKIPINLELEKGRLYKTLMMNIEEGQSMAANIQSDLLNLLNISDPFFLIAKKWDGGIHISKKLEIDISIANILKFHLMEMEIETSRRATIEGLLILPFPNNELKLNCKFTATPELYHSRITIFDSNIKLPILSFFKGLKIGNIQFDLQGSFVNPNSFIFGIAGDFAIGEQLPSSNDHDFTYSSLKSNEFNFKFIPENNSYIPTFVQLYIDEVSISKALTLITGRDLTLPEFLDPIKLYSTYFYYCAPNQHHILLDGVVAKKGLAISTGISVLGLQAYAEYSSLENEGVTGIFQVEPIDIPGIISITGKGTGTPEGYRGKKIPGGGMEINFYCSPGSTDLRADISILLLNFMRIETGCNSNNDGLTFYHKFEIIGFTLYFEGLIKSINSISLKSEFEIPIVDLNLNLGPLGKLNLNLDVSGKLLFILQNYQPRHIIECGFSFNDKYHPILDLNIDFTEIKNLVDVLIEKVKDYLDKLLSIDVLEWLKAILSGALRLADDAIREMALIGEQLITHFKQTFEAAAGLLKDAKYHVNQVVQILDLGFKRSAEEIGKILSNLKYSTQEIIGSLSEVLNQTEKALAQILKNLGHSAKNIIEGLKNVLKVIDRDAAQIMKNLRYSVTDISSILKDVYQVNSEKISTLLKEIGFGASDITSVLKEVYKLGSSSVEKILKGLGYASDIVTGVIGDFFGTVMGGGCKKMNEQTALYYAIKKYEGEKWHKLNILGQYRDEVLAYDEIGRGILSEYYELSDKILNKTHPSLLPAIYEDLYHTIAIPASAFIELEEHEKVYSLFKEKLVNLKAA